MTAESATTAPPGAMRPREALQRIRQACRQVLGIPDFEHYRAHMLARHPGVAMLCEREFHVVAIDRRYGSGRSRCC